MNAKRRKICGGGRGGGEGRGEGEREREFAKKYRKTRGRIIAGSQRRRPRSTRSRIGKEKVGKRVRGEIQRRKDEGRKEERERDEGPKETRVPECLFEFLAKWSSVRSAGPGHPSRPSESASQTSQPAGVKRNHTDLHIMIYIPVLCLFYSSFSRLVSCHRALRRRRPLVTLPITPLFCLFFVYLSSILCCSLLFCFRIRKMLLY